MFSVSYQESDVKYVPCSGLVGENLITPSSVEELKQWYSGPTLLDIIGTPVCMHVFMYECSVACASFNIVMVMAVA